MTYPTRIELRYLADDGTTHVITEPVWDPARLSDRDRHLLLAMLSYATERVHQVGQAGD